MARDAAHLLSEVCAPRLRARSGLTGTRVAPVRLLLCLMLSACTLLPPPRGSADPSAPVTRIFVVRRSWHVDVGFARADLRAPLTGLLPAPQTRYLLFGFGDRHYLLAREHGPSTLLAAAWPGPGMILTTALKGTPEEAFGAANVVQLAVSARQLQRLERFIWGTLSEEDRTEDLGPGPYPGSRYYASPLRYSALHTCNTWVAQALQSAGLAIRSTGVVLAGQIWHQVERLERAQLAAPAVPASARAR